jgi:hypothetical protein
MVLSKVGLRAPGPSGPSTGRSGARSSWPRRRRVRPDEAAGWGRIAIVFGRENGDLRSLEISLPLAASHSRAVLSRDAVNTRAPPGEKAPGISSHDAASQFIRRQLMSGRVDSMAPNACDNDRFRKQRAGRVRPVPEPLGREFPDLS